MAERLNNAGHKVIGYADHKSTVDTFMEKGLAGVYSLEELVDKLKPPRAIWLMIPAGQAVDVTINKLLTILQPDDTIIDGGNSNYKDSMRRSSFVQRKSLHYLDVGTSGGIWGLKVGYCMMIGGEEEIVQRLRPIFEALAPSPDKGWAHVGPNGSGHFVKMIHNGIEYGLMQAYAEGFAIMKRKDAFQLDLQAVAEIWRYGSVIRSWLLDLIADALSKDSELKDVIPYVADSGEGRWTALEAVDLDVPAPVITLSLLERLRSRDSNSYSDRLLAVMREEFGGHQVKRKE